MEQLSPEEKFIYEKIKENGGKLGYKALQDLCAEEFEGVRLILKKMKEKGIVDYEGVIPGFSAEIVINKEHKKNINFFFGTFFTNEKIKIDTTNIDAIGLT